MSTVANLYDNGPISPIVKIDEKVAIWTRGKWDYFNVDFIEGMPRGSTMAVEMITAAGQTTLAANAAIAKRVVAILQLDDFEMFHLRWEPVDDVEGVLWEQAGQARFATRNTQARVTRFTHLRDPYLAATTFYVLGRDRDMNLEVRNPNPVAIALARFAFWGYRYKLTSLPSKPPVVTYLPAEGR